MDEAEQYLYGQSEFTQLVNSALGKGKAKGENEEFEEFKGSSTSNQDALKFGK